ncbi:TonB-dependent siderophore receptor [Hylemonella gracilis]|nr:TonB-dependent siderophore receptor [Hylemonella gracilis]
MKKARTRIEAASKNVHSGFDRKPVAQAVLVAFLGAACVMPAVAQSDSAASAASGAKTLEAVTIVSQREARVSTGATGLNLEIKETPQSISVVTAQQMQDFGATNLNDALRLSTGIQVEEWETNRTNYMSRGFEIKSTQIDGVGMPNDWGIVTGAMDSFGYEKVEVIRGANGLLTGVGNSSGTINYVRKRPTNVEQGSVGVSYGSWGTTRAEVDYSKPLSDDGRWAGRVVAVREEGGSYLRDLENERTYIYGVVDGQVGDNGTLALGYSYQQANTDGNMWGALTFSNNDGSQAKWSRSASTTQDWTYWNTNNQTAFVEYIHQLAADWQLKTSYNFRSSRNDDQLFYVYSSTGLDPNTGSGATGWPGKYVDESETHLFDVNASGSFGLFGRQHELIVGASHGRSKQTYWNHTPASGFDPVSFPLNGNEVDEPDWGPKTFYSELNLRLTRMYGTTRLQVSDKLKVIGGFNFAEFHRDGNDSGTLFDQTEREISPYAGVTYDFTDRLMGYASYSDIYQPQDQQDINGDYLDPSKGVNYEAGVKMDWLNKRLLTSLAWFRAEQKGLSVYAGTNATTQQYYYTGMDVESQGLEFEVSGKLDNNLDVVLGYTTMEMTDTESGDPVLWAPRQTANLAISGRVPSTPVTLGANGRWQSKTSNVDGSSGYTVRQDSYAVLNAFAAYQVTPKTTLRFNVKNLTDEKYINSLYQIGYYGAPRSYQASLNYKF